MININGACQNDDVSLVDGGGDGGELLVMRALRLVLAKAFCTSDAKLTEISRQKKLGELSADFIGKFTGDIAG